MGELSEKAFPFDSDVDDMGNYDREYLADDFARYFRAFISSGTFMGVADNLQIIANGDMTVTLRPGSMIIDGYRYDNVADIIIPIEPADGVVNRIDRISITWINEERDAHKTLQKGTPSYIPVPPECRRNEEYKDYVLADIYIPAGAIDITQDMITDQRLNSEVCGLAIAFSSIDTAMIFDQLQAFYQKVVAESTEWKQEKRDAFENWFTAVRNTLSGDVAGNLLNQIGILANLTTEAKNNLVDAINEVAEQAKDDILDTMEEIEANTDLGKYAGANALKDLNNKLAEIKLYIDKNGKLHFVDGTGADTVIPFSSTKTISIKLNLSCSPIYAKSDTNGQYEMYISSTTANVQIGNKTILSVSASRSNVSESGYNTAKTTNYTV